MMFRHWLTIVLLFTCGTCVAQESRTYFVTDAAGSPILGTDSYANVKWTEDYLPFGERRQRDAASGSNERWFTGAPQNEDTGLVDLGYRTYDPVVGRFMSIDPAGAKPENTFTHNLYSYGNNNPYRYIDPDGRNVFSILDWKDFAFDVGGLLVSEIVYVSATVLGDSATANAAIDGMIEKRFAAAASTVGIVSPVPRTGNVVKAARYSDDLAAPVRALAKTARETVRANKARGDAFRDEIADLLRKAGRDVKTEVVKDTPFGRRVIDIEVSKDGKVLGGIETKTGGSRYTPSQRAKDEWLRQNGYPVNVVRDR